jgi:hypothetical protein
VVPSLVADKRVLAEEERSEELNLLETALDANGSEGSDDKRPESMEPVS